MPPRKRAAASSTSSRKLTHAPQPSQPSKFGIQHFFERHSQATAAVSSQSTPSAADPPPAAADPPLPAAEEPHSQISPEVSKSTPLKRFKFSPGMLIKQSQDDVGEEVTWKISPVNERLKVLTAAQLPRPMRIFPETPWPGVSLLRPCSENQMLSTSAGRIEKWLSSPLADKCVASSSRGSPLLPEGSNRCPSNGKISSAGTVELGSPFRTPPSTAYGTNELVGGVASNGDLDQSGRQHRKALLELLDQVEDAITEESQPSNSMPCNGHDATRDNMDVDNSPTTDVAPIPSKRTYGAPRDVAFLVLEVFEKHRTAESSSTQSPYKVLRLLDEQSGQERTLHLYDEWFYSLVGPGDTIHFIGEFDDQGKGVVDHDTNLVVVHPDILLSGSRVASSFNCSRRSVLDERLKSAEYSTPALIGTLLHQIFQAGLLKDRPTRQFLEEYAGIVLHKNIESLYACGVNEKDVYLTLIEAIPKILNWLRCFTKTEATETSTIDFGHCEGQKTVQITEVIDIEEVAWSPKYGLKGMIDASVRIKMNSSGACSHEKIMPLEFKSGKGTTGQAAMEHSAQVILYTLLMSDRYLKNDIDSGLLYYLHTDQTLGIKVQRSDLIGLVMRRNEFASELLKASTSQTLPPMLQNLVMCKSCRHLNTCTLYHKAHGGDAESSGLGDMFNNLAGHLTKGHINFLKHWERLIDMEAKVSQASKKEILHPDSSRGEHRSSSLSSMVLDAGNGSLLNASPKNGKFVYNFVCHNWHKNGSEIPSEGKLKPVEPGVSNANCTLRCGDYVIISTESGRIAVANGIVCAISHSHISVSFSRRLRLPGSDPSSESLDLLQEHWRINKDEFASSLGIMRFNLVQMFVQSLRSSHLRKVVVDLEAPRFDSGGMFSQDPALSYIRSEKNLNDDQRRAIHKILAAKDYTLILGMPGTGKTSTMVHAVKALLMRGSSILLTSYTNSAVDNLLIKLKAQGISFIRIGRHEAVHDDVREHCLSALDTCSVDDIKQRIETACVVGVTCLGINHPLLANKKFDICIMDEAGQITLPVSLGPLMLASTFVLVGDHYQLPPLVQSTEARENGMGISLFCRLSEAHPQAISALRFQYRMCTGIMELSNALIYGNRLCCGSSEVANAKLKLLSSIDPGALWLKEVLDPNRSVIFVNTDQLPAPEAKEHKSVNNPREAYIVSEISGELVRGGIDGDEIGVITPYNSQANLIRSVTDVSVEIHTIDKYQGRDKDCVLVSFVRSSESSRACTSSLLGDWHRINVAITRAKKKLILVGSCKTLSKVPLLKLLIEKVDEQGGLVHLTKNDIPQTKQLRKCSQMSV